MKAPKCKLCGAAHGLGEPHQWGEEDEVLPGLAERVAAQLIKVVEKSAEPARAAARKAEKFDRNAYQREYMRKRRAAGRAAK